MSSGAGSIRSASPKASRTTRKRQRSAIARLQIGVRHESRIRVVRRASECREVHAAEPPRGDQARHRVRQAADDAEPDSGCEELSGCAGGVPRYARHSSAAASNERAHGRRGRRDDSRYPADYLTDQPERFFAAEIVREKLLQFTHAEIPFSSPVLVDRFEEPAEGDARPLLKLYCTIVVDRESQKPIVVGRGGEMIKRIGTAAREELEKFFDTRVFLDLHVRVKAEWREDEHVLSDIGLKEDTSGVPSLKQYQ